MRGVWRVGSGYPVTNPRPKKDPASRLRVIPGFTYGSLAKPAGPGTTPDFEYNIPVHEKLRALRHIRFLCSCAKKVVMAKCAVGGKYHYPALLTAQGPRQEPENKLIYLLGRRSWKDFRLRRCMR